MKLTLGLIKQHNMKNILFITLALLQLIVKSQNLTLTEIINYKSSSLSTVNNLLLSRGWEVEYIKKSNGTNYNATRWIYKSSDGSRSYFEHKSVPKIETDCIVCNKDFDIFTTTKTIFLNYKKQLSANKNYISYSKIRENAIVEYFYNEKEKIKILFKTFKQDEDTYYMIECHDSFSAIMMKDASKE